MFIGILCCFFVILPKLSLSSSSFCHVVLLKEKDKSKNKFLIAFYDVLAHDLNLEVLFKRKKDFYLPIFSIQYTERCNKIDNFPDSFSAFACVSRKRQTFYLEAEPTNTPTPTELKRSMEHGKRNEKFRSVRGLMSKF